MCSLNFHRGESIISVSVCICEIISIFFAKKNDRKILCDKIDEMVVLDATQIGGTALLGSPYAQGAPALKIIPKRYLGVHQWLSPIATKDLKEQIVSFLSFCWCFFFIYSRFWFFVLYSNHSACC